MLLPTAPARKDRRDNTRCQAVKPRGTGGDERTVERVSGGTDFAEVLERVLDKGVVIEASVGISLLGIELIAVDARVVIVSLDTYLKHAF